MKKIKLVVMLLIVAVILVFTFQNQTYFQEKQHLGLTLPLMDPYSTPEVSTAVVCIVCCLFPKANVGQGFSPVISYNSEGLQSLKNPVPLYYKHK